MGIYHGIMNYQEFSERIKKLLSYYTDNADYPPIQADDLSFTEHDVYKKYEPFIFLIRNK